MSTDGINLHVDKSIDIDFLASFSRRKSLLDLVRIERDLSGILGVKVDLVTEKSLSPYLIERINKLVEHPFGTIKRSFNQGYMLLKRLYKVGTEISLTVLAYDITRVINIVGVEKLMTEIAV